MEEAPEGLSRASIGSRAKPTDIRRVTRQRSRRWRHGLAHASIANAVQTSGSGAHGATTSILPSSTDPISKSPLWMDQARSEEHTSELQSLMRISYAVF